MYPETNTVHICFKIIFYLQGYFTWTNLESLPEKQTTLLNNNDNATVPVVPLVKYYWPSDTLGRIQHTNKVKFFRIPKYNI